MRLEFTCYCPRHCLELKRKLRTRTIWQGQYLQVPLPDRLDLLASTPFSVWPQELQSRHLFTLPKIIANVYIKQDLQKKKKREQDSVWECFPFAFSSAKVVLSLGYQHMAQMLNLRKSWHPHHAEPCYFPHVWYLASVVAIQCQLFLNVRHFKKWFLHI